MKKFGTPTDGAPGSDTEYVGFRSLGTPRPAGRSALRVVLVFEVVEPVVEWGRARRFARDRERVARRVAGSERELVGRAADVEVVDARFPPVEVVPGFDPSSSSVVTELVDVVGEVRVVMVGVATVVGGVGAEAAGVAVVGLSDAEVEVETEVVGGAVTVVVVVEALVVVVDDGALAVVVEVLVTVVVVEALVVVVALPAHEFVSVSALRSIEAAAAPSWLVTAASSALWPVTPAATVTPGIVVD